jgi:hypothetical protein
MRSAPWVTTAIPVGVAVILWLAWRAARFFWQRRTWTGRLLAAGCLAVPFALGAGGTAIWGIRLGDVRGIDLMLVLLEGAGGVLVLALLGMPALVLAVMLVRLARGRRWGPLNLLLGAVALAGVLLAAVVVVQDRATMQPEEHYSWRGGQVLAGPAAYAVGAVLVLARVLRALAARVRRRLSRSPRIVA